MTLEQHLLEYVKTALAEKNTLHIQGGNSKAFYGNPVDATYALDMTGHTGVVDYMPTELCITVRAGTPILALEAELAKHQQVLPFEPPIFSSSATIGGAVAAGLSGPRRPYSGSVRDAILGMKLITGTGEIIQVGGQVMKNVAGYDISRLMTGSLGTLGVILEVSLKVIPKPREEKTVTLACNDAQIIPGFTLLRTSNLPITASCYIDETLSLRLSGTSTSIQHSIQKLQHNARGVAVEVQDDSEAFWQGIRNHTHPFFQDNNKPLWRLSVAPAAPASAQLNTQNLTEWGGGVRWISSNTPANIIVNIAKKKGGHATLFRGDIPGVQTFPEPEPALMALYKSLKKKLDPQGIFNPGRMYRDL